MQNGSMRLACCQRETLLSPAWGAIGSSDTSAEARDIIGALFEARQGLPLQDGALGAKHCQTRDGGQKT